MTWRLPRALALLALPLALAAGACSERLDTAAGCPVLCPGQTLDILDTVIDPAVVLDTTLSGFPLQGEESPLLLAKRGDSLDVRAIVRFDTLVRDADNGHVMCDGQIRCHGNPREILKDIKQRGYRECLECRHP